MNLQPSVKKKRRKDAELKKGSNQNLPSLAASNIVNAVICVAVFHFPRLFTATA